MTSLVRTEWLKMKKYNAFWWIMGITALSYPGVNYIFYKAYDSITQRHDAAGQLAKVYIGNPFTFPEVWHTVGYFSSLFVFIPAVVVIMFISNEYTFKTHRQNIIDGWSRSQFVTSKLIDVLIISLIISILYAAVSFVMGVTNQERLIQDTWSQAKYIGLFTLQTFAQLSIAFLIGFLIRKAFMALGVFLFYYMILEPILVQVFRIYVNDSGRYLPLEISDRLVPVPAFFGKIDIEKYNKSIAAIPQHVILTLLLTAVIWAICYRINNRRDLK
jgi:ABC-type transport system involved in multi-copper enzyme maturation permease subunit